MSVVHTVRSLTRAMRDTVETRFPFVWVRGQVSNLSRPGSGHIYFTLKDEEACLNVVWFRDSQRPQEDFDPLTGEVFEGGPRPSLALTLENGQEVLVAGPLTVYAARGAYQLLVEVIQESGQGRLHLEFERLKRMLAERGYFSPERKRPVPVNPVRVALVTAVSGAAIRDFLRLAGERGTGAEIRVFPSLVQGERAPEQLVAAMSQAMDGAWAQVVVLIRGGGSLEDLWAFNDLRVAEAIFQARLPVLTGVGHEVDFTIADLVADLRAATPSHAAQLLWPERHGFARRVDDLEGALDAALQRALARLEARVEQACKGLGWCSPRETLVRLDSRFAAAGARLGRAWTHALERRAARLARLERVLERDGGKSAERAKHRLALTQARLAAYDPLRPLRQGYGLIRTHGGRFVRSVREVSPGDGLEILVADGSIQSTAHAVTPRKPIQEGET